MPDKPEEPDSSIYSAPVSRSNPDPIGRGRRTAPDDVPLRGRDETVRETITRVIRESEELSDADDQSGMPSAALPFSVQAAADKAVLGICELLGLLFGLPFGDDLYHGTAVSGWHIFYLGVGVLFAGAGPMWPLVRTRRWMSPNISASISRAAYDARLWIAVLLILFAYVMAPEIYQRAISTTPPVPTHDVTTKDDIAKATARIQAERDSARSESADVKLQLESERVLKAQEIARATSPLKNQIAQLQTALNDMTQQRDEASRRGAVQQAVAPTSSNPISGPITWNNDLTTWNSSDQAGMLFLGIGIVGKSNTLTELSNAFIVSELTGEKKELQISLAPGPQLAPISEINGIPPDARIELWATFKPPIHATELLTQWGRFRFHAEYSGVTYNRSFDENYINKFLRQFQGTNIGPHITKKAPANTSEATMQGRASQTVAPASTKKEPPANIQDVFRSGSFKVLGKFVRYTRWLDGTQTCMNGDNCASASFEIENLSGVDIKAAIKRGSTSIGSCVGHETESAGLNLYSQPTGLIYGDPNRAFESAQRFIPAGAKVLVTIKVNECSNAGDQRVDISTALTVSAKGTVFETPISASNVVVR